MKITFLSILTFFFAKVSYGKDSFDFLDIDNFNIDITQEDIYEDLMNNQS